MTIHDTSIFQRVPFEGKYNRFENTKKYLNELAQLKGLIITPNTPPLYDVGWECMEFCGYSEKQKWSKFNNLLYRWHNLQSPIPKVYCDYIDIESDVLKKVVEIDRENYFNAIKTATPTRITTRFFPAIYGNNFVSGMSEQDVINYCRDHLLSKFHRVSIHCDNLKSIFVDFDGERTETFYVPTMTETKTHYIFSTANEMVGTTHIN